MTADTGEAGYFPPGTSVLRRVLDERLVGLFYGVRAAVVGALEPGAFIGTNLHTVGRSGKTFSRLGRTHQAFETVVFGTRAEADAVSAKIARMHATVRGEIDRDLGPGYPAGTPYSATDPWLSYMTMAFLADSAHCLYTTYVRDLDGSDLEAYWQDWLTFGELFGMTRGFAPQTWGAFREQYDAWLASDRAYLIRPARRAGMAILRLPLPAPLRALNELGYVAIVATLPEPVREAYGLPWRGRHEAAFRTLRASVRTGRRVTPDMLATGRVGGVVDRVARLAEPGQVAKVRALRSE